MQINRRIVARPLCGLESVASNRAWSNDAGTPSTTHCRPDPAYVLGLCIITCR